MAYTIVRENIFSLNAVIESAYNVRNAPSPSTDAIGIQYSSATPPQMIVEGLDYDGSNGDNAAGLGPLDQGVPAGRFTTVPISMYWRGRVDAYASGKKPINGMHSLLQAAGLTPTGSFSAGAEKYTYAITPDSTTPISMSLDMNAGQIDGTSNYRQVRSLGTMFSLKFDISGAKPCLFTFDGKGTFPGNPTEAAFTAPTLLNDVGVPNSAASTLTLGGVTLKAYTTSFDQARVFYPANPFSATGAHEGWCAGGMKPTLKVQVAKTLLATFDPYALRQGATKGAMVFAYNPGGQYNRFSLNGLNTQVMQVGESKHGNIGCYDLTLLLTPSNPVANDFFTIVAD